MHARDPIEVSERSHGILDRSRIPVFHPSRIQLASRSPRMSKTSTESPPSTESISSRLSRKRAPTEINKENNHLSDPEDVDSSGVQAEAPTHVCLCQPEPRIPRPRNGKEASSFCFENNLIVFGGDFFASTLPSSIVCVVFLSLKKKFR